MNLQVSVHNGKKCIHNARNVKTRYQKLLEYMKKHRDEVVPSTYIQRTFQMTMMERAQVCRILGLRPIHIRYQRRGVRAHLVGYVYSGNKMNSKPTTRSEGFTCLSTTSKKTSNGRSNHLVQNPPCLTRHVCLKTASVQWRTADWGSDFRVRN
jgi:hypothetical protein